MAVDSPVQQNPPRQLKYQIFISSTFDDLIDERRAATEVILGMGHIPVGMEVFEAGNEDQWSYIQNRISEVDYYLVIVAERYGSIGPQGVSYTEMEYRFAAESGVPLAALLLSDQQRQKWPRDKIDFENQAKLNKFRDLCKTRMVATWDDAGSLASKCQLALNNLFRRFPRPGWISADQAISPQIASELARLSEENAKLRRENELLSQKSKASDEAERLLPMINQSFYSEIKRLAEKFGGDYAAALADEKLSNALKSASVLDLLINTAAPFLDGANEKIIVGYVLRYIESKGENSDYIASVAGALLLRMRTVGLIEAYEGGGADGKPVNKLRLSALGRKAFDLAFDQYPGSKGAA